MSNQYCFIPVKIHLRWFHQLILFEFTLIWKILFSSRISTFLVRRSNRPPKQYRSKKTVKPIRADTDAVINNQRPMSFEYRPTLVGAGKISIDDRIFDYHFKSQRISFWRCSETGDCPAKVITRGKDAWYLHKDHDHYWFCPARPSWLMMSI